MAGDAKVTHEIDPLAALDDLNEPETSPEVTP